MNKLAQYMEKVDMELVSGIDHWVTPDTMNGIFDEMISVQQLNNGRLRILLKDRTDLEFDLGAGKLLGENGEIVAYAKLVRYNTVELGSDKDYVLI